MHVAKAQQSKLLGPPDSTGLKYTCTLANVRNCNAVALSLLLRF